MLQQETGREYYQERVKTFVQEFIEHQVLPSNNRDDIRAIIIMGEASETDVKELGDIALDTVGTKGVELMTDFEPSQVVAHGAAVIARLTEEHPKHYTVMCEYKIPDDEYWAEEAARKKGEVNNMVSFENIKGDQWLAKILVLHLAVCLQHRISYRWPLD